MAYAASALIILVRLHRAACDELPPFTQELAQALWQEAEQRIDGLGPDGYTKQEGFVCASGNWGDGPQCNQWDKGYSPCWPSTMTISASWDTALMARWSAELAEEFGVPNRGQLGPGVNLARFAWNGRIGEYMAGEDPFFGAKMVEAMVTAVRRVPNPPLQVVKHFIPNTIENGRRVITEVVDERTLFEVYYPPFAAAVEAGISAVMCSYNLVKCTSGVCSGDRAYACASDDVLNKHLKQIMGFKGIVMSDWHATRCQGAGIGSGGCPNNQWVDGEYAAEAGLDLEMPECLTFSGGVTKRAREKAVRLSWAYMVQGRKPGVKLAPPAGGPRITQTAPPEEVLLQWARHPGKCLQVAGLSPKEGLGVELWDCIASAKQVFLWHGDEGKIRWAAHPEMCLDVSGRRFQDGTRIQMWKCTDGDDDQIFKTDGESGPLNFHSKNHPGLCLDVRNQLMTNGNMIQLWQCQNWAAMKFTALKASPLIRQLKVAGGQKCLQVDGVPGNGSPLGLEYCNSSSTAQLFTWAGSPCKIRLAEKPNLCVDVRAHRFLVGNPIQLWECQDPNNDQLLNMFDSGAGKISSHSHPEFCLDAAAQSIGHGIQLSTCKSLHQNFTTVQASVTFQEKKKPVLASPSSSPRDGIYDDNVFGSSKSRPSTEAASAAGGGERCPFEGGNNYKNACKLALADRIIAESTVVLKNKGGVLPLSKKTKVALVGHQACSPTPLVQGCGSGWNGFACNQVPKVNVKDGIAGLEDGPDLSCPDWQGHNVDVTDADVVLVVVSPAKSCEGSDRKSLQLYHGDIALIRRYVNMGKKVVVAMNAPGPMITSTWDEGVDALIVSWLPGQQNGRGIAMALYNEGHEASGRLPFTFPKCSTSACTLQDEHASVQFGHSIQNDAYHTFSEKALIGYRWYHAESREVSYPFGFGLFAYGSAEVKYSGVAASVNQGLVTISCVLEHAGPRTGHDVPQLYVSFPRSIPGDSKSNPEWVLKGFTKVPVKPGVPKQVSFTLTRRDVSYWDDGPGKSHWVCVDAEFTACVGANFRDAVVQGNPACTTFTPDCGTGPTFTSRAEVLEPSARISASSRGIWLTPLMLASCAVVAAASTLWAAKRSRQQSPLAASLALEGEDPAAAKSGAEMASARAALKAEYSSLETNP